MNSTTKMTLAMITPLRSTAFLLVLLAPQAVAQDAPIEGPPEATQVSEDEGVDDPTPTVAPLRKIAPFQADWGLAAVIRTAQIPFATENDSVSSFVPMMFYEGDYVFLRGMSSGVHAWKNEKKTTEFNLISRLRFVDIPAEFQNQIQGDTVDLGVQMHSEQSFGWWDAEALSDTDGNWRLGARIGTSGRWGDLLYSPTFEARYLSGDFTENYYALPSVTGQSAGASFQLAPGILARYHVFSDIYLLGSLRYTWSSAEISDLDAVDKAGVAEAMVGFGFFQDAGDPQFLGEPKDRAQGKKQLDAKPYVRLAHGWATPSNLSEIIRFDIEEDEFDNQMTSVFYGHPLTDRLFGAPIEVYVSPGFAWHHESEVQSSTQEAILYIKAYYTLHWPIRWRLGAAEGVSWINEVTYIEQVNMDEKGYRPSQWMNYIDLSLDLNVGDIVRVKGWDRLWAGVAVHHRSSIFESASQFGRIKGGSNYPSIYLQWDLY